MLIVIGVITVHPTDIIDFVADLRMLAVATRRRDGNLAYDAGILDEAIGQILVAERWQDQGALTAHLHANDTMAFVGRWQDRMHGDVQKFDATNGRGLDDT